MITKRQEIVECYRNKLLLSDFNTISDGIAQGKLGLVIYFLAQYKHNKNQLYLDKISDLLEAVFENCNSNSANSLFSNGTLSYGATGLGMVLASLLKSGLIDASFRQQIEEINEFVLEKTLLMIEHNNFSFLEGSIGNLFYLNNIKDQEKVDLIIDTLKQKSEQDRYLFYSRTDDPYMDGINLGLNHGYLSTVKTLLLCKGNHHAKALIQQCINVLIQHIDYSNDEKGITIYKPYSLQEEGGELKPFQNNRLCWCNSDLSLSYILYKTGRIQRNKSYIALAEKIGAATTARKVFENTGVENYHFCHGSSGLVQLYQQLYSWSGKEFFRDAENYWMERTVDYLESEITRPLIASDLSFMYGKVGALLVVDQQLSSRASFNFLM